MYLSIHSVFKPYHVFLNTQVYVVLFRYEVLIKASVENTQPYQLTNVLSVRTLQSTWQQNCILRRYFLSVMLLRNLNRKWNEYMFPPVKNISAFLTIIRRPSDELCCWKTKKICLKELPKYFVFPFQQKVLSGIGTLVWKRHLGWGLVITYKITYV